MNLLILGGTIFLGRHLVDAATARGHRLTLFTRGKHNPELYPEVERLRGDRDGDMESLKGRTWDAVVDTCGYVPRVVRQSAELLAGAVGHYTFISSISAYADFSEPGLDETAPVAQLADPASEEIMAHYGALKAACEQVVDEALPGRALLVRPGLIVGPHDPSDRFTYWPRRIARGGEVLAPAPPDGAVQVIDARDLAEWTLRMVEEGGTGVYNATGPEYRLTLGAVLDACRQVSGSDATVTWVDEEFVLKAGVQPWTELPLWVPQQSDSRGIDEVSIQKALRDGLTLRPLADTIRDTLAWDATRAADTPLRAGLAPEREREVLAAWHASREGGETPGQG